MAYDDMRAFIAQLEKEGQYKHIDVPIDCARGTNELQALMRYVCDMNGPALQLDNLQNYNRPDVPVIFNPFGTRERTAMTLGLRDWRETKIRHADLINDKAAWLEPKMVDRADAPCKEEKIEEADVALDKQIPHVWFGKEGPSYITNAITVSKDPETGERNVGWYRYIQFWNASHPQGKSYSEERAKRWMAAFFWWNPPMSHIGLHVAAGQAAGNRHRRQLRSGDSHRLGHGAVVRRGRIRLRRGHPGQAGGIGQMRHRRS